MNRPSHVSDPKSHFTINRTNAAALEYLEHQQQAKEWMEEVLSEKIDNNDLSEALKDGVLLCKLISVLHSGSEIKVITSTPHAFRTIDNIHAFLEGLRSFGLREIEIFSPGDLYEKKNMPKVMHTLRKLAELAGAHGFLKWKPAKRNTFSNTEIQEASRLPGVTTAKGNLERGEDFSNGLSSRGGGGLAKRGPPAVVTPPPPPPPVVEVEAVPEPEPEPIIVVAAAVVSKTSNAGSNTDTDSISTEPETMEQLLEKMEKLCKNRSDGSTPLHIAADLGNAAIIEAMLKKGYDPNAQDNDGNTPLHIAASRGHEKFVLRLLGDKKTNVDTLNRAGASAIQAATEANNPEIVRLMARDYKANVNTQRTEDGWSPLYTASYHGNKNTVDVLLNSDADPNLQNTEGWTALHAACHQGHLSIVKELLSHGATVNTQSYQGTTPLFHTVETGWMDIITYLVEESGADIHLGKPDGWRPVHMGCFKGFNDVTEYLVEKGAGLDDPVKDEELKGYTPLHIVLSTDRLSNDSRKNLVLLMTKGANLAARDARGSTPLHLAAYWNNIDAVTTMMQFIDSSNIQLLSIKDSNKETPIEVAAYYGNHKIVDILAQKAALDPSSFTILSKPQITSRMQGPNAPPAPPADKK